MLEMQEMLDSAIIGRGEGPTLSRKKTETSVVLNIYVYGIGNIISRTDFKQYINAAIYGQ